MFDCRDKMLGIESIYSPREVRSGICNTSELGVVKDWGKMFGIGIGHVGRAEYEKLD